MAYRVFVIIKWVNLSERAQNSTWNTVKPHGTVVLFAITYHFDKVFNKEENQ